MHSEPSQNGSIVAAAIMREITLRGLLAGPLDLFKRMLRLMTANPEITRPLIDRVFSFEEIIKAFEYLESQAHVGKVVIKVT
ncbi:hypothetical protein AAF712_008138 [Marasmius tenuissimus]|uniref:Alcohol dehydrogenase n=1 Tax=Marasmius tenuissimus TaxID=585030 RepID=A0ABR2ZU92_9AGAR